MEDDDIIDLSIEPERAFYIVVKAREWDEKVGASDDGGEDPGSNPSDDEEVEILEDRAGDPTHDELMAALNSLNEDQQLDLIALMWIGRGDYDIGEWETVRQAATDMGEKHIPSYLSQTPLLSDYLEEGLNQAGYTMVDYELSHL
jgi:hypothetical protein